MQSHLQDLVLPAGRLDGEACPWVEEMEAEAGEAAAAMAGIAASLAPQAEREERRKLEEAEERQREAERRAKDAPFRAWLRELSEMLSSHEDEPEGRTEIEFSLYRIEKNAGIENACMLEKFARTPRDAMAEGMPDLEGIALAAARKSGHFGAFRWNIRAWIDGEQVKATSMRLNIAEPPGYVPPVPERKDPMSELNQALSLVKTVREAFGSGGGESGQSAALLGRLEAMEGYRRELRELEDRHRRETRELEEKAAARLKEETREAFDRGRAEGQRDARSELERKIWELERDIEREKLTAGTTDMVDKVVSLVGGPDSVKALVGGLMAAANKPNAREVRPKPPLRLPQPRPMARNGQAAAGPVLMHPAPIQPGPIQPGPIQPGQTPGQQAGYQPGIQQPEDPGPEAIAESLATIEDAVITLRHSREAEREDIWGLMQGYESLLAEGRAARGAAVLEYWRKVTTPCFPTEGGEPLSWLALAEKLLDETEEENDAEAVMSTDELKALLLARLSEGKTSREILTELDAVIDQKTRQEWQDLLRWVPTAGALGFLGIPEALHERGAEVLEAFRAA